MNRINISNPDCWLPSSRGRVFVLVGWLLLQGTYTAFTTGGPQDPRSESQRTESVNSRDSALRQLNASAKLAESGDRKAVRNLVDAVFTAASVSIAAESLKKRVVDSEMAFREGSLAGIPESAVMLAINAAVQRVPNGFLTPTNAAQVRLFREFMGRYASSLVSPSVREGQPVAMSPAEATLITFGLLAQKLANPQYQIAPDEWVKGVEARRTQSANNAPSATPRIEPMSIRTQQALTFLEGKIGDETSDVVRLLHSLLDTLGLSRLSDSTATMR